jgi:hypothetical protein
MSEDWADEIAKALDEDAVNCLPNSYVPVLDKAMVAAALRKAKADGMRESAERAEDIADMNADVSTTLRMAVRHNKAASEVLRVVASDLRSRAARLEQPR